MRIFPDVAEQSRSALKKHPFLSTLVPLVLASAKNRSLDKGCEVDCTSRKRRLSQNTGVARIAVPGYRRNLKESAPKMTIM